MALVHSIVKEVDKNGIACSSTSVRNLSENNASMCERSHLKHLATYVTLSANLLVCCWHDAGGSFHTAAPEPHGGWKAAFRHAATYTAMHNAATTTQVAASILQLQSLMEDEAATTGHSDSSTLGTRALLTLAQRVPREHCKAAAAMLGLRSCRCRRAQCEDVRATKGCCCEWEALATAHKGSRFKSCSGRISKTA
eukprot:1158384-Pelagomonas_calceolata.AAC.14